MPVTQFVEERLEEGSIGFAERTCLRATTSNILLAPLIGEGDELEITGGSRVVNAQHLDDDACIEAGCVGEELAEMIVVGRFELVLDDDGPVAAKIMGEEIEREGTDRSLARLEFEVEAEGAAQVGEVVGKPGCETAGFVRPDVAESDVFERAEVLSRHRRCRRSKVSQAELGPMSLVSAALQMMARTGLHTVVRL